MIKPLTSLRFVFAVLVFLSHMWFFEDVPGISNVHNYYFKEGFIGVSFFFILSGFVLSYSYKEKIQNGSIRFFQFWKARFARIYPLHFLTLLIAIPLMQYVDAVTFIKKLLLNVLLLQSFVPSDGYYLTFNAVAWSLSDEMFFYLSFPILIFIFVRKRYRWLSVLAYITLVPIGVLLTREVFHHALFYVNPLCRIGDFIIGMMLYRLYAQRKDIEILNNRKIAGIAEVLALGLLFAFVYFHEYVPLGYRYSIYYILPMCVLVYVFAYSNGFVSRFLSNKILVSLGDASFAMYMVHVLLLRYYIELHMVFNWVPLGYTGAAILFAITLVTSLTVHKFYEMPMNSYVKKKLNSFPSIRQSAFSHQ